MAVNTIGSGGDFADLTTYESALQGTHGATETARLISDITDNVVFGGWGIVTLTVEGNLLGFTKRVIASAAVGTAILRVNDASITSIFQDLEIDGTLQTGSNGVQITACAAPSIGRRLKIYNIFSNGYLQDCPGTNAIENVIVFKCGASGIRCSDGTTNQKNNGSYENADRGFSWSAGAAIVVNLFNCWGMKNAGNGFINTNAGAGEATVRLEECVSSDTTATDAEAQRTVVGGAINKTDYTDYFTDPDNATIPSRDFRLLGDDNSLWGIDGNAAQTPADDFSSLVRVGKDIGPHDFFAAADFTRILRSPLRGQSRDSLLAPVS